MGVIQVYEKLALKIDKNGRHAAREISVYILFSENSMI